MRSERGSFQSHPSKGRSTWISSNYCDDSTRPGSPSRTRTPVFRSLTCWSLASTKAWSVRDIIAHVTTWEEETLKHLPAILEGRRPPLYSVTYGGIDAFNALMTTTKAGLSLAEVYRQREEIHRQVVDTIVRTPDAQLACDPLSSPLAPRHVWPLSQAHAIRRWRTQRQAGACVQTSRASP
jgi:hypothetical protein